MKKETIISVNTGKAVKNVGELRENIKHYKKELEGLNIGSEKYRQTLTNLEQNQAALRNAMHATTGSFKDLQAASIGLTSDMSKVNKVTAEAIKLTKDETTSYNELVRVLAQMKEAWRSTTNADDRKKLGETINAVNDYERFFKSDRFHLYTDVSGESIIRVIRQRVKTDYEKEINNEQ